MGRVIFSPSDSRRLKFLGKFTAMRSLSVEYDFCCSRICSRSNNESPMVKFKFGPNSVTVLIAGGVEFLDDYDVDVQGYQNIHRDFSEEELAEEVAALIQHVILDIWVPAVGMEEGIKGLLENYVFAKGLLPRLQNVVAGDRTHGKIVMGERDLVGMRNMKGGKRKRSEESGGRDFSVRFAPVLKLPSSGCVMTMVALITFKDKYRDINDDDAGDELLMLKEGFAAEDDQGEEEAYVKEAALAMLKEELVFEGSNLGKEFTFKGIKLDCFENFLRGRV